jgi:hypothetical protein
LLVIVALFTNVCPACIVKVKTQVNVIVPPLPAGSVAIFRVVVGIYIHVGTISWMTTFCAAVHPLLPYVIVYVTILPS